jgi:hypothetical protein
MTQQKEAPVLDVLASFNSSEAIKGLKPVNAQHRPDGLCSTSFNGWWTLSKASTVGKLNTILFVYYQIILDKQSLNFVKGRAVFVP